MHKLIVLGVLPAIALASPAFHFRRTDYEAQTCEEMGLQQCGTGCIKLDYTCCPSEVGGCPPGNHCVVGDDGQPGCCLDDYVCTGNGGVVSTTFSLTSATEVSETVVPEPTTTATEGDGSSTSEELVTSTTEAAAATTEEVTSTTTDEASATTEAATTSTEEGQSSTSEDAAQSSTTEAASASATETITSAESTSTTNVSNSTSTTTTTTPSTTAFTTSTVYTTTTKTITSCPASHPCHSGTGLPPITVITETIAVSTTICPVVESPPLPLPTTTIPPSANTKTNNHPHSTTILVPINPPTVHCPGHGSACHSVITVGTTTTTVKAVPTVPITPATTTTAARTPTGTGAYRPSTATASATGRVVTAGAAGNGQARAGMGMAAGVVGVVVFDLLQHAGFQF